MRQVLEMVTINENPRVVGSAAYTQFRYPSDIDVFDQVVVDLPIKQAGEFYAKIFINLSHYFEINSYKLYFTDFKAGEHPLMKEIAHLPSDQQIEYLYEMMLISDQDYNGYYLLSPSEKDLLIKEYRTVRWNLDEIKIGYKKLWGEYTLRLAEAVTMNAVVKLDVITWANKRFQSIETFYHLHGMTEDGQIIAFHPLGSYQDSLLSDIEKYGTPDYYNPLKILKRVWALSNLKDCTNILRFLTPVLNSDVAALSQVNADIETISQVIESGLEKEILPADLILTQILSLYKRIVNHVSPDQLTQFNLTMSRIYQTIDKYQVNNLFDMITISQCLNQLKQEINPIIREESEKFLEAYNQAGLKCQR